jgi:hypothetical protein
MNTKMFWLHKTTSSTHTIKNYYSLFYLYITHTQVKQTLFVIWLNKNHIYSCYITKKNIGINLPITFFQINDLRNIYAAISRLFSLILFINVIWIIYLIYFDVHASTSWRKLSRKLFFLSQFILNFFFVL